MADQHKRAHLDALGHSHAEKLETPGIKKLSGLLLTTASAAALSILMTHPAHAQAVPAECTPTIALTGGTIICTATAPTEIGGIATTVDDLTIIVGDATTPTAVSSVPGDGVSMSGGGAQTLNIVNTGSSVRGTDNGVDVSVTSGVDDLTIVSEGAISGVDRGISADQQGSGDIRITANAVTGGSAGIGSQATSGDTTITLVSGAVVTSRGGWGIIARSTDGSISVDSSAGTVMGDLTGIFARDYGAGAVSITTADVTGARGSGITVRSEGGPVTVTSTGAISGDMRGIFAQDYGAGGVSITTADVTGTTGAGIWTRSIGNGDVMVNSSAGAVSGGEDGIFAKGYGRGAVSVSAADVTGASGAGILVTTFGGSVTIDSSAGTVAGSTYGIDAKNTGTGATSVTTANVTGGTIGINTRGTDADTHITLSPTAIVTGQTGVGIDARSTGTGTITIQGSSGDVVGATDGIYNRTAGTAITIDNLDSVTGNAGDGIDVASDGGNITITDVGSVTGTNGNGILAVSGAGDISIQAVGLDGGINGSGTTTSVMVGGQTFPFGNSNGIFFNAAGSVNIGDIEAIGDVTATNRNGIYGRARGGITIETSSSTISGGYHGIFAESQAGAALSITTADVTGTSNTGIVARSYGGGSMTVDSSAGTVTGGNFGIVARDFGAGVISITTADAIGTSGDGIVALSSGGSIMVDSSAGMVTGDIGGIRAENTGAGTIAITANMVTGGTTGIESDAVDGDTVITLTSTAVVTGQTGVGIDARSTGTGAITIQGSSGNVIGATDGIYTRSAGAAITVDSLDSVTGQAGDGIDVASAGGAITITSVDTITGTGGVGILADSAGGDVSIQDVGTIGGVNGTGGTGIFVDTRGGIGGNVNIGDSISNGDVSGRFAGIVAYADVDGSINIDSSGSSVMGSNIGIFSSADLGDINITAGDTTTTAISTGPLSVFAVGGIGAGDVNVTLTGDVMTDGAGVAARSIGMGSVSVNAGSGTVTSSGTMEAGILAVISGPVDFFDPGTGTDIIVSSTGDVTGGTNGIETINRGFGSTTITALNSTGTNGDGISAISGANATDVSITSTGTVIGSANGIDVAQDGSGILNINVNDVTGSGYGILTRQSGAGAQTIVANNVTATTNAGIFANGNGSSLDITVTGAASGLNTGIDARNEGSGALTINAVNATGTNFAGIFARNGSYGPAGTDLSITSTGTVSGAAGINAVNNGNGILSITTADVTGTTGHGIFAGNSSAGTDIVIDTTAGDVVGAISGIDATNNGSGSTVINSSTVIGTGRDGIFAQNGSTTDDLTITTADNVQGTYNGIFANNQGSGEIVITATGATGLERHGIYARNNNSFIPLFSLGTSISVVSDAHVSGRLNGTYVRNFGAGITTVDVTSTSGSIRNGIFVSTFNSQGVLISASETVSGGQTGVLVRHAGSGSADISIADARGTTGSGIYIRTGDNFNAALAKDVTVSSTGDVFGGTNGIHVQNYGSGILSISAANVTGETSNGIEARNGRIGNTDPFAGPTPGVFVPPIDAGTDLTIVSSGNVVGGTNGIIASSNGTGTISITAANSIGLNGVGIGISNSRRTGAVAINSSGRIEGTNEGIFLSDNGAGAVTISVNDVVGGSYRSGIRLVNNARSASDTVSITSTGLVSGGENGIDLFASDSSYAGGPVSVTTNNTTGVTGSGISVRGYGAVDVIVDSKGTATGGNSGIAVSSRGGATINSVNTVGGYFGISASSSGAGGLTIKSGDISITDPNNGIGISAFTFGDKLSITSTGTIVSGNRGIYARNYGSGDLTIHSGAIAADNGTAITAKNGSRGFGRGADLRITATDDISGGMSGIEADNNGSGSLNISAINVTGANGDGINARNGSGFSYGGYGVPSTDLTISIAGTVTGGVNGINAANYGTGNLTLNIASNVTGGITGIFANAGTGDLLLDIGGDVTAGDNGIITVTEHGTDLTVAVGQTISGGTTGITAMAQGGSTTSNDNLNILGTVNGAIMTFAGDDIVTVADGGTVNGAIILGAGDDTLNYDGGTTGILRGGDDADILNFNAAPSLITNSGGAADAIAEFETYNFNTGGFILGGVHSGLTNVNFNAGEAMLLGTLSSTQSNIAAGAMLHVDDGAMMIGNLANAGSLDVHGNGTGTFTIDGNFTQNATGDLTLAIQSTTDSDLITVTGDVTLGGTLNLVQADLFTDTITLIDGSADVTGSFETVTGLQNGLLGTQSIVTDLATSNVNLVTGPADANLLNSLTPNQAAVANALTTQFVAGSLTGDLQDLTVGLGVTADAATLSALLDELTPEIANAGIDGVRLAQNRFRTILMSQYLPENGGDSDDVAALGAFALAAATGTKSQPSGPQIWGGVNYNYHRNDAAINNKGYRADGFEVTAGINNVRAGAWQFGFAAGYSDFDSRDLRGTRDKTASELFRFGVHGSTAFDAGSLGINGHVDIALDYGTGSNDITMFTDGGLSALGTAQSGSTDTETYGMSFRLNLDGSGDKQWPVRPFVSVAYDHFSQDSVALAGGGVTDLVIDDVDLDRIAFGYGIRGDHDWGQTALRFGIAGYHYEGDTQANVTSRFLATGVNGAAFTTVGFDIKDQFQIDAGISQNLGDGWSLSLDGYTEFGDLEGYGGLFKIARKF